MKLKQKIKIIIIICLISFIVHFICNVSYVSQHELAEDLDTICREYDPWMMESEEISYSLYKSGVIYNASLVKEIKKMVKEMHTEVLDHKQVTYYSPYQAIGHYIKFLGNARTIIKIKNHMKERVSYDELLQKYPKHLVERQYNVLIVKEKKYIHSYNELSGFYKGKDSLDFDVLYEHHQVKGSWGINSDAKTLQAYYFTSNFKKWPLPQKYNKFVNYAQYMVGDQKVIISNENPDLNKDISQYTLSLKKRLDGFEKFSKRLLIDEPDKFAEWWHKRDKELKKLSQDKDFIKMLSQLSDMTMAAGIGNNVLEHIVANCISKEKALQMKRKRQVWGGCSRDRRPMIHARNIAILATQTCNKALFLRTHLNILNDNFPRWIDSGYGKMARAPHINELQAAGVYIEDLLFGINLIVENSHAQHYYGNHARIGWALASIEEKEKYRDKIRSIALDKSLDPFNRVRFYALYCHYLYRENGFRGAKKTKDEALLKDIFASLPF